ncbi:histidine kinase [Marinilabiliaceae bacterium JC017]|nr:histidine kinase [Marinilabiliaceae bacterium JC017]
MQKLKTILYRLLIFGLFSIGIGLTFLYLSCPSCITNLTMVLNNIGYSLMLGYGLFCNKYVFNWFEAKYIRWIQQPFRSILIAFAVTTLYSTLVIFFVNGIWYGLVEGLSMEEFFPVLKMIIYGEYAILYFIALWFYARSFFLQWREALQNKEELKREALALQYEALKNQVNPHFLFNSLNVLTSLIDKDTVMAKKFVKELSAFYRDLLQLKQQEVIGVGKEMKIVSRYIYLQSMRFGKGFSTEINACELNGALVVPLSVQMLVENAFKHNSFTPDKPLNLEIYFEDDYIGVRNNLQRKAPAGESSQIGLQNLKHRYHYLTGKEVKVEESSAHFDVKLPLIKN